eukprot:FR734887.1.p1 GENE.FR734887.1~~FR734887.1.p1  ORF type:complete len:246 (-),score=63.03 FR734887.1:421-1158(-)
MGGLGPPPFRAPPRAFSPFFFFRGFVLCVGNLGGGKQFSPPETHYGPRFTPKRANLPLLKRKQKGEVPPGGGPVLENGGSPWFGPLAVPHCGRFFFFFFFFLRQKHLQSPHQLGLPIRRAWLPELSAVPLDAPTPTLTYAHAHVATNLSLRLLFTKSAVFTACSTAASLTTRRSSASSIWTSLPGNEASRVVLVPLLAPSPSRSGTVENASASVTNAVTTEMSWVSTERRRKKSRMFLRSFCKNL